MNKFTEASLNYFFNVRNNARKDYDKKIATISNKLDNALSREPEVMIIIDGYAGMINPFPISKIKKI